MPARHRGKEKGVAIAKTVRRQVDLDKSGVRGGRKRGRHCQNRASPSDLDKSGVRGEGRGVTIAKTECPRLDLDKSGQKGG